MPTTPGPLTDAVTRLQDAAVDARAGGLPSLAATLADLAATLSAQAPTSPLPAQAEADPLAEVLAWLGSLPPITRARYLTVLLDRRHSPDLMRARGAAVAEAVAAAPRADVAEALGVAPKRVSKILAEHRATQVDGCSIRVSPPMGG